MSTSEGKHRSEIWRLGEATLRLFGQFHEDGHGIYWVNDAQDRATRQGAKSEINEEIHSCVER